MSQVLRIVGLEEDGIFGSAAIKTYNSLASHSHKRNYLSRIMRNGYAAEEMGLSTLIELIQTTDGKKFMKMSQRDRLKRLLSLINVVMCEDVPVLSEPDEQPEVAAAPAAVKPAAVTETPPAAAPEQQPQQPAATVSEPEPAAAPPAQPEQPEPVAKASEPEEKASAAADADSDGTPKEFGAPRRKSGKGRSLISQAGSKS